MGATIKPEVGDTAFYMRREVLLIAGGNKPDKEGRLWFTVKDLYCPYTISIVSTDQLEFPNDAQSR